MSAQSVCKEISVGHKVRAGNSPFGIFVIEIFKRVEIIFHSKDQEYLIQFR